MSSMKGGLAASVTNNWPDCYAQFMVAEQTGGPLPTQWPRAEISNAASDSSGVEIPRGRSKVENDVPIGLRAANQRIGRRRRVDWLGAIGDGPSDESRLASMADASSA